MSRAFEGVGPAGGEALRRVVFGVWNPDPAGPTPTPGQHGGKLMVLAQPWEFVIIGGAAFGTLLIANPADVVKDSGKGSTLSRHGFWYLTRRKSVHFRDA